MPSRKQRRRRAKELRHDYEFVYLDAEGRELEAGPDAERAVTTSRREEKSAGAKKARGRGSAGRGRRVPQPPSWTRAGKRALIFFPLFYLAFSLVSRKTPIGSRLLGAAGYSLLFIPLTYMIDRTSYRTWIRRGGDPGAAAGAPKKRRI